MIPAKLTGLAGLQAAAAALPNGAKVAIIEPFYKMCADGGMGVRVDDQSQVGYGPCVWMGPSGVWDHLPALWGPVYRACGLSTPVRWRHRALQVRRERFATATLLQELPQEIRALKLGVRQSFVSYYQSCNRGLRC